MKNFFPLLLVAFLSWTADAASWYVDNTAAGTADGTSWANAWTHLHSINWSAVNAGDTIFISGGTTNQTYGGFLLPTKDGTSTLPITITAGTGAGHNGLVIFDGGDGGDGWSYIGMNSRQFITIDGQSAGDGLQHFALLNLYDTANRTLANKIQADSSYGCTFRYLAFTNVNQCVSVVNAQYFRVSHCTGDDIRGDAAVRAPSCGPDGGFDRNFVENCWFQLSYSTNGHGLLGPDGIQASHAITVRNNTIRVKTVNYDTSTQHPDATQIIGNYVKIYGNEFVNVGDSGGDYDWVYNPAPHDIRIYNNVWRMEQRIDPFPEYIRWYASAGNSVASINNVLIANNLFADNTQWGNVEGTWPSTNPTISGWVIANNIFLNGSAYSITDDPDLGTGNVLGLSHNVYDAGWTVIYRGANYAGSAFSAVEPSAIFGRPSFVSYSALSPSNDFHLGGSDTVAHGAGVDLSAYFTTDKDGNTRTTWDAGPYAYSATGTPPNTPSITSIPDGSTGIILTPLLYGSTYSDPNGNSQSDAEFVVYASDGTSVVWDSSAGGATLGPVNFTTVPGATLNYSTAYKVACRYKNILGLWSAWSAKNGFTTQAPTLTGPGSGAWNVQTLDAGSVSVQH